MAKGPYSGQSRGVQLRDENGDGYGVSHTGNAPHVLSYAKTGNDTFQVARIDAMTHSMQTIEYEHHEIHGGSHYNYCDYQLNNALNALIEFIFTTPDSAVWTHLTLEAYSGAGATVELYSGASGIAGGTAITPRNNNRNVADGSTITLLKDPTSITADGVRAAGFLAGAGKTSGFFAREKEIILKQNTTYLVRIKSLANSNDISWCAEWYEHTSKSA